MEFYFSFSAIFTIALPTITPLQYVLTAFACSGPEIHSQTTVCADFHQTPYSLYHRYVCCLPLLNQIKWITYSNNSSIKFL